MKTSRLLLLTVVVLALLGLTTLWSGSAAAPADDSVDEVIPAIGTDDTLSSTWYCAAGGAGTDTAFTHSLYLANPSDETVTVRLSAFNDTGQVGTQEVDVAPRTVTEASVDTLFAATNLSVMAESESGTLAVEHRLSNETMADTVPCATTSSDAWFFPSQTTLIGTTAKVVLFNPFSADAGVDITAPVSDGLRAPAEWAGIVVPAGTTRVVDLSQFVQRRDQFSVAIKMRTGRVVAETAQTFATEAVAATDTTPAVPATRGVRLQLGVPEARTEWTFAGGFKGAGVQETLVVYNPNREPTSVVVQVTPYGAGQMPPEPFELDVPGNRFAVIDLSAETRLPDAGFQAIQVESSAKVPVVVARTTLLTAAPPVPDPAAAVDPSIGVRPNESFGAAIGTATPTFSARWIIPFAVTGPDQQPMVFVHNPGSGIVTVSVDAYAGEEPSISVASDVEVLPGDSVFISLATPELAAVAGRMFEVRASAPVAVERTVTFAAENDLSIGSAVPAPG